MDPFKRHLGVPVPSTLKPLNGFIDFKWTLDSCTTKFRIDPLFFARISVLNKHLLFSLKQNQSREPFRVLRAVH